MFFWKAVKTHPLSQKCTLNGMINKICSQLLGVLFLSNTFIFGFALDELCIAIISFYEINILKQNTLNLSLMMLS